MDVSKSKYEKNTSESKNKLIAYSVAGLAILAATGALLGASKEARGTSQIDCYGKTDTPIVGSIDNTVEVIAAKLGVSPTALSPIIVSDNYKVITSSTDERGIAWEQSATDVVAPTHCN